MSFLIVINLLEASIYVFDKKFDCIKRVAKVFFLRKVESDLIFNVLLLLLSILILLSFV